MGIFHTLSLNFPHSLTRGALYPLQRLQELRNWCFATEYKSNSNKIEIISPANMAHFYFGFQIVNVIKREVE